MESQPTISLTDGAAPMAGGIGALFERIGGLLAHMSGARRLLIGIAGAPGAGKTTLARELTKRLNQVGTSTVHVPMDGFHLADQALDALGRRDRKGAPDTFDPGGYAALLARIANGERVWAPAFERDLEQPLAQAIEVPVQTQIVISEGNYLLLSDPEWQEVRRNFTEVWFCEIDDQIRRERLIARHIEFGKSPTQAAEWVGRVDDPNATMIEAAAADADLIVRMPTATPPHTATPPRR